MYVVTFYSFKGGVGRTMSLVNVAAELAKRGRRVLMVDFDLEAPGLSDFELIPPTAKTPGLVEFVTDYIATGSVPDVSKYMYQSEKYEETGNRLWVMPAGCQNGDYQSLFSSINWQDLYESNNGYLLMEDMRAQWKKCVNPDYVFIDSRTGYTDIAGICTRQLPDAVCLVFTPNKQNLTGLTKISADIKAQNGLPGLRQPKLLFVASNIPSLEDDEDVLKKALGNFSRRLEYATPSAIIHHYNSFALINEAVFTIEYPKNPLANEYRLLADEICKDNFQDRRTVIDYLSSVIKLSAERSTELSVKDVDQKFSQFEVDFFSDAEVLFWMSRARRALGSMEEGAILLDAAIRNGLNTPRGYLDRSMIRMNQNIDRDNEGIWSDLKRILQMQKEVLPSELLWTIKIASWIGLSDSDEVLRAPAIQSLTSEDIIYLADKLHDSQLNSRVSLKLLSTAIDEGRIEDGSVDDAYNLVAVAALSTGNLDQAADAISKTSTFDISTIPVNSAFNYAMAMYWMKNPVSEKYFNKILSILNSTNAANNANYLQCLSFSHFALRNLKEAYRFLELAKEKIGDQSGPTFSCWRYLEVSPSKFNEDLTEMEKLYDGIEISPLFLRNTELRR